jgi:hypothetical protein
MHHRTEQAALRAIAGTLTRGHVGLELHAPSSISTKLFREWQRCSPGSLAGSVFEAGHRCDSYPLHASMRFSKQGILVKYTRVFESTHVHDHYLMMPVLQRVQA